ncbi:hypothetical protein HRG84_13660 [Flavisolibacter sp. BT320]|nr:hypothetical protein [Flavisolibacter longurius]
MDSTMCLLFTIDIMQKLLIIDDKNYVDPVSGDASPMTVKWLKDRVGEYSHLVEVAKSADKYFEWDIAGNACELLFEASKYSYVFIHHSQQGDSYFPSNIIDLIKIKLQDRLILFSGNIKESFLNTEYPPYIYRSITRPKLWDRFSEFLKKSVLVNEWLLEVLFFDYEKRLVGRIVEMQDNDYTHHQITNSKEFIQFLKLKCVGNDTATFKRITNANGPDLIDELRKL